MRGRDEAKTAAQHGTVAAGLQLLTWIDPFTCRIVHLCPQQPHEEREREKEVN